MVCVHARPRAARIWKKFSPADGESIVGELLPDGVTECDHLAVGEHVEKAQECSLHYDLSLTV